MTISPELHKVFSSLDPQGRCTYLRTEEQYWDFLGIADDGTLRLYPRKRPPYWRTVKALQDDLSWKDESAPGGFHPLTIGLASASVLIFTLAQVLFADDSNPGKVQGAGYLSLALFVVASLTAFFPPSRYFDAYDEWVQSPPSRSYEDHRREVAQKEAARRVQHGQFAIWSELHSINQAMHPGNHNVPPYGPMPPV